MHFRWTALLASLLACSSAFGRCTHEKCFQVSGLVTECEAVRVDGKTYFRLIIPEVQATFTTCRELTDAFPGPSGSDAAALDYVSSRHVYFVESASSCRELKGTRVLGRISEQCCDTEPAHGSCKLTAPLLLPN